MPPSSYCSGRIRRLDQRAAESACQGSAGAENRHAASQRSFRHARDCRTNKRRCRQGRGGGQLNNTAAVDDERTRGATSEEEKEKGNENAGETTPRAPVDWTRARRLNIYGSASRAAVVARADNSVFPFVHFSHAKRVFFSFFFSCRLQAKPARASSPSWCALGDAVFSRLARRSFVTTSISIAAARLEGTSDSPASAFVEAAGDAGT